MLHYLNFKTPFSHTIKNKMLFLFSCLYLSAYSPSPLSCPATLPLYDWLYFFSEDIRRQSWRRMTNYIVRTLQWVLIFKELRNIAGPLIPLNKSQFNTIFALLVITNELILEMNSKTRPKCFNLFPGSDLVVVRLTVPARSFGEVAPGAKLVVEEWEHWGREGLRWWQSLDRAVLHGLVGSGWKIWTKSEGILGIS